MRQLLEQPINPIEGVLEFDAVYLNPALNRSFLLAQLIAPDEGERIGAQHLSLEDHARYYITV